MEGARESDRDSSSLQSFSLALFPDGSYQVTVTDNAIEEDPSGTGTLINVYALVYIVRLEQGSWKMSPEDLKLQSTQGMCHASTG